MSRIVQSMFMDVVLKKAYLRYLYILCLPCHALVNLSQVFNGNHAYNILLQLQEESSEMIKTRSSWKIFPGQAFPLGVSEVENGINFSIFSQHATSVTLCLVLPDNER